MIKYFANFFISILSFLFLLSACVGSSNTTGNTVSSEENTSQSYNGRKTIVRKAPVLSEVVPDTIKYDPDPYSSLVEMQTRFGTMKIELFFDAEKHRENFLRLAKKEFYDSLICLLISYLPNF